MNIKHFLLDRLDERSTWRAIVAFLTLIGIGLSPDQRDAIITAGVAIGAALEALLPDPAGRIHPPAERLPEPVKLPAQADDSSKHPSYSAHDDAFGPWNDPH